MKRIFLLFAVAGGLTGQILPTVPSNVFRFSAGANVSGETWNLEAQQFALQGFGRHYFDHMTHNDSVRFSSNNDLYYTGTVFLDSVNTVEQWLTQFNTEHNFSLPVFGPQPIDTTRGMAPACGAARAGGARRRRSSHTRTPPRERDEPLSLQRDCLTLLRDDVRCFVV